MNFNRHLEIEGQHAFLGASKYHWIYYDKDKLIDSYSKFNAVRKGIELHDFAERCIRLRQRLPKAQKTLNMYVNDAIGFRMNTEQVLYYSSNCFGTADAISFRDNILRIHDFKSGITPAKIEQLAVYAALFCLEYKIKPSDIEMELRIYQSNDVLVHSPDPNDILTIMDKVIAFDKIISKIKSEEE